MHYALCINCCGRGCIVDNCCAGYHDWTDEVSAYHEKFAVKQKKRDRKAKFSSSFFRLYITQWYAFFLSDSFDSEVTMTDASSNGCPTTLLRLCLHILPRVIILAGLPHLLAQPGPPCLTLQTVLHVPGLPFARSGQCASVLS